jgi:catechol 2,3-dioxygenase-like lactoylglutathione lyase family enzyme
MEVDDSGPETRAITGYADARLKMADLACPNGDIIELIQYVQPVGNRQTMRPDITGNAYVAFTVSNAEYAHDQLTRHSVNTGPLVSQPGSKSRGGTGYKSFYAIDPDGRPTVLVESAPPSGLQARARSSAIVQGISHVALIVGNLERSVRFHCENLSLDLIEPGGDARAGLNVWRESPDATARTADLVDVDGRLLRLIESAQPQRNSVKCLPHDICLLQVGFRVTDVARCHRDFETTSIVTRSAPVKIIAPGSIWDGALAFYAVDPDARTTELIEYPSGTKPRDEIIKARLNL